MKLINRL